MTEVRTSPSGTVGLFATRAYVTGEVILDEAPWIRLATAPRTANDKGDTRPSKDAVLEQLLNLPAAATKKDDKGQEAAESSSFLDRIAVPSSVESSQHSKFRSMVSAAACFVVEVTRRRVSESDEDTQQWMQPLLDLFHPSIRGSSEQEAPVVELSREALDYLDSVARSDTALSAALLVTTTHDEDATSMELDDATNPLQYELNRRMLQQIMLIWACNSFAGGLVYRECSRINHSCNPNAIVQHASKQTTTASEHHNHADDTNNDCQVVRAARDIALNEELSISYLGLLLYADRSTRQAALARDKYFVCHCRRCDDRGDVAAQVPCPQCHPRVPPGGRQLDEEDQYDDDLAVQYAWPTQERTIRCGTCNLAVPMESVTLATKANQYAEVFIVSQSVVDKVVSFLQDKINWQTLQNGDGQEQIIRAERLEQHATMASCVLGAKHWATNLLMLLTVDEMLQSMHSAMLAEGKNPDLEAVAEVIDMLERLFRFVGDLELDLHPGHLLSDVVVGTSRALVSLGDVKSQKFAADWIEKIVDEYVAKFESPGIQKVVTSLHEAWKRTQAEERPEKKMRR